MSGIFSKAIGLNGLSYRLLSYILICSTVLALVITVLQLAWDYNKDVTVIEASIEQFIQALDSYIRWYNEKRIKISLGALSPIEYRESLGFAA